MRKFKLIKKIFGIGMNGIFDETGRYLGDEGGLRNDGKINKTIRGIIGDYLDGSMSDMYFFKYFKEIKQKVFDVPEFKIGDYVVVIQTKDSTIVSSVEFMKIVNIKMVYKGINNFEYRYNLFSGDKIRKPTEEELSLYFR